jgi:hypothetical protein
VEVGLVLNVGWVGLGVGLGVGRAPGFDMGQNITFLKLCRP